MDIFGIPMMSLGHIGKIGHVGPGIAMAISIPGTLGNSHGVLRTNQTTWACDVNAGRKY